MAMGMNGDSRWLAPDSLVLTMEGAALEWERGLGALFGYLAKYGPAHVPREERAASMAGCSLATLKRRIRVLTGRSWRAFILAWRMEGARGRLGRPFFSVKELSAECGYASQSSFARAFRRYFGCSPTEMAVADGDSVDEDVGT